MMMMKATHTSPTSPCIGTVKVYRVTAVMWLSQIKNFCLPLGNSLETGLELVLHDVFCVSTQNSRK